MKKLLIACLVLLMSSQLFATHIAGGNIEVQYVGPNSYQLILKLYRSCEVGAAGMPTSVAIGVYELDTDAPAGSYTLTLPTVTTNLPFGDACFTPTGLCVDQGIFTSAVITIPDHAAGYYVHAQIFARNGSITNINTPGNTALSFYTEIPDPAIGINNTPQFGPYPADAYFCAGITKSFDFGVSDIDGDSLSYELVDPLAGATVSPTTNGTYAKPHPPIGWAPGFSLFNIIGGSSPLVVDATTGIMTGTPALLGKFVFALKVHEWRSGVKIGETTLDIQYESLNCFTTDVVEHLPMTPQGLDTVTVYRDSLVCFDVYMETALSVDTVFYSTPQSSTFSLGASVFEVAPFNSTNDSSYYLVWNTVSMEYDSVATNFLNADLTGLSTDIHSGVGTAGFRFCWQTDCSHIADTSYTVSWESYSIGCYYSDTIVTTLFINVIEPDEPPIHIAPANVLFVRPLWQHCFDIKVVDNDTAAIPGIARVKVSSELFALGAYMIDENNDTYDAANHFITDFDTVHAQFCWTPPCEALRIPPYSIEIESYSHNCKPSNPDTVFNPVRTIDVHVLPHQDSLDNIEPNVFTPNGDGINDFYTIDGITDPCFDFIDLKIYNRWGTEVYKSEDPYFKWDGKNRNGTDLKTGTYFVLISGSIGSFYDMSLNRTPNSIVQEKLTIHLSR